MSRGLNLDEKTFGALRKAQVSLAEHFVMCTLGYRIKLPKQSLAGTTRGLSEGDSRGSFSQSEYKEAIEHCVSKKWLHIFTPKSYEAEVKRQRTSQIPELFDTDFQVGAIYFTRAGYLIFRQTILEVFGQDHIENTDCGWNSDEKGCRFQVLASTRRTCLSRIEELSKNSSLYTSIQVISVASSEPEQIGLWKPNPFIELSQGFCSEVRFESCSG